MTWQSRVPAVLDALVSVWGTTSELSGVVQDGPRALNSPAMEELSVGYDGSEDGQASDGVAAVEGFGIEPNRERFTVTCLVQVLNGAGDMRAARVRAFELLSAAAGAVAEDKTLGGVVMQAAVQDQTLSQLQTDRGAWVRLAFTVACEAFTAR